MTAATDEFEQWWAVNHPHDWFAALQSGRPVSSSVRIAVWMLAKGAYIAGAKSREARACRGHAMQMMPDGSRSCIFCGDPE